MVFLLDSACSFGVKWLSLKKKRLEEVDTCVNPVLHDLYNLNPQYRQAGFSVKQIFVFRQLNGMNWNLFLRYKLVSMYLLGPKLYEFDIFIKSLNLMSHFIIYLYYVVLTVFKNLFMKKLSISAWHSITLTENEDTIISRLE